MASQVEHILILAKTYPSPSALHVETSCVAGINAQGEMRRLYPVPFRLIEEGQKSRNGNGLRYVLKKPTKIIGQRVTNSTSIRSIAAMLLTLKISGMRGSLGLKKSHRSQILMR